jgi:hypothetical protein
MKRAHHEPTERIIERILGDADAGKPVATFDDDLNEAGNYEREVPSDFPEFNGIGRSEDRDYDAEYADPMPDFDEDAREGAE